MGKTLRPLEPLTAEEADEWKTLSRLMIQREHRRHLPISVFLKQTRDRSLSLSLFAIVLAINSTGASGSTKW